MIARHLSDEELTTLFQADESDYLERSESTSNSDKICKAICAFANDLPGKQQLGVLIIGQKDNKACAGLNVDDKLQLKISSFRDAGGIIPMPAMTVQKHTIDGCTVCVVTVAPSSSPPVRYKGDCWVRVAPSIRLATVADEIQLNEKRQSGDIPYMEQEVRPPLPLSDINLGYFRDQYLPQAISPETLNENQRSEEHQLQSLRFLSRAGTPNNAAILCFHNQPHHVIGGAYIQFLRVDGNDLADDPPIRNKKEIAGNIFEQARQMDEIVRNNVDIAAIFRDGRRHDRANYPLVALQEILRNALVHRSYEGTNAPIRFYWFSDRIEILSPGGLYGQVTRDNLGNGQATGYRNLLLAEAMTTMGFAERFGNGINKAQNAMKKNGNPEIEFTPEQGYVLATLKPTEP